MFVIAVAQQDRGLCGYYHLSNKLSDLGASSSACTTGPMSSCPFALSGCCGETAPCASVHEGLQAFILTVGWRALYVVIVLKVSKHSNTRGRGAPIVFMKLV